ncbi:glycosyltransferase involved in cell wall biosynthesis [Paenibacillus sp. V4I3]|uniref:bifunctional glycosyltransferase family 2/GtrA family protein n=1 Tax=unclassified Paenibacillus TaxID=185978 RepID=UPI0027844C21|nr:MULTISPECIES: bifunctional glycosyltransferase family 2/GtrA family protein [unclassified Paenibacillus]MDQ0877480.1 glycosyltransferase involved in cell wall biosynthesis [Paenibacillus sp. V4I3]MDQ0886654.1 glycosyltransferase involved in cell wall biosynthesis [Paenibacillus sp. V4I9]
MTVLIPSYEPDHRLVELIARLRAMTDAPIVVVDDGSGENFREIFEAVKTAGCTVLTHISNMGKGRALKTGFQYIMKHGLSECVVCADSDGQHAVKDIVTVAQAIEAHEATMVLGSRRFTGKVPLRSRIGNRLTSKIYDATTGIDIRDTQTGLRGYPSHMLSWLCQVPGERFEYEMNLLLEAPARGYNIAELPIDTIYLNDNRSSHFRPIADSLKVYLPILKFCASSVISGLMDFALLLILQMIFSNLLVSVIGARVGSSAANYAMNRLFIFSRPGKGTVLKSVARYYSLAAVILALNYGFIYLLHIIFEVPLVPAKLATEFLLFLLSYWCQRKFVY